MCRHRVDVVYAIQSGVGVTKAPLVDFSVRKNVDLSNAQVRIIKSLTYLTDFSAAKLR